MGFDIFSSGFGFECVQISTTTIINNNFNLTTDNHGSSSLFRRNPNIWNIHDGYGVAHPDQRIDGSLVLTLVNLDRIYR